MKEKYLVKKKTQYQKNIGNYANSLNENDEKYNNRIKKLNWFWKDLCNYKIRNINIEDLIISIDNIDKSDIKVIEEIINQKSCVNILEEIIRFKIDKILKKEKIEFTNYTITRKRKDIFIYCFDDDRELYLRDIFLLNSETQKEIITFIKKRIYYKYLNIVRNNNILFDKIQSFNKMLQLKSDKYYFYDNFRYGFHVYLEYDLKKIKDIKIPYDIADCQDGEVIELFLNNYLNEYLELEKCVDENKLYDVIEKLDNKFKEVYILRRYLSGYYRRYFEDRFRLRVCIDKKCEGYYKIKLLIENETKNKTKIHEILYLNNYLDNTKYNDSNLHEIQYKLLDIFNNEIIRLKNQKEILKIWGKLPYKKQL